MSLGKAEDEWKKALDEWENCKNNNKKERDNSMLELNNVELPEEKNREIQRKFKFLKMQEHKQSFQEHD